MISNPKGSAKQLLRLTGEFSGVQGVRPAHTHQLYFCVVCRGRVNTAGPTNPGEKGLPTRLDVGRAPASLTSKEREAHGARSCVPTVQVAELLSSGVWKVGMCQAEGAHGTFHCTKSQP